MKEFIRHLFTGCVFISFLLVFQLSLGQNQIVPVKSQYKSNPVKEQSNLKSEQISNLQAGIADKIQTGNWIATTGTGFAFEFVVNDDATKITQFKVIFTDYTCGSSTHNGSVTTTSTWNINNREFTIYRKDYFTNEEFTISGTFADSGKQASGNWDYKSKYGNCSGTWTAIPEDGGTELPDLIATVGGFDPDEASKGEILNVNVTVKNTGVSQADTSTVAFYLCEDPNVSVTDILIGIATVSALNAGEEATVEIMYEITDNLPAGTYYVGYQLDYYNSVEEIENDNYYYLPESLFTRLANSELIVANKINDVTIYIDSVDFTLDLEASPAVFYYSNPDITLSYSSKSSDNNVASTSVSGSVLTVSPVSEGLATISVIANDGKGGTVSTDFQVEVKQKTHSSPGKFGGCLVLDGIDDYAEAYDHEELDLGNLDQKSLTIEAWVKFEEFGTADIISKSNAYRLYTETSTALGNKTRVLGFIVHSGASNLITAVGKTIYGGGFWIEGWHHVAGVYNDLTGELSLYMDGEQLSSWESGNVQINNSTTPLKVGTNLHGRIDEMRISKSARYSGETYEVQDAPFFTDENTTALWHFDDPLESLECYDCCKEDNCLFLFKGAFLTSTESFDKKVSNHFELFQNYPNPFNGSTTIEFNVFKTSHLQIRIYDILGHEVNTLVEREYLPGNYQIIWNGKNKDGLNLVSGIYLVKMQSGEFLRVKKVLLKKY